jgi:uncharacterized YccA/Bax inhibitor family protein
MNTSNPTLSTFNRVGAMGMISGATNTMTVAGTIGKTGLLASILAIAFGFTWTGMSESNLPSMLVMIGGMIGGLILALIIIFKPTTAPYLSPAYAAVEGVVLAGISYPLELRYPGIALQAATLTIATLFGMLLAYRTGIIVVNNTFRAVVVGATLAVGLFYLVGMVLMFFNITIPGIGIQHSWMSIGISLVIVVIAAMNLALDFDLISQNAGSAPKYMEWYGAFSLMVTLIWLYIELLRLLASLRGRN